MRAATAVSELNDLVATLLSLAAVGTPIFAHGVGVAVHAAGTHPVVIALHRLADMPSLIAVPLFTFAGVLAEQISPAARGAGRSARGLDAGRGSDQA